MKANTQTRKRTPLTRVFSIIMALFMAVMVIPDVKPLKAYAAEYNIWILGHQVTDSNKSDILGSSSVVKFSFDYNTNTLTVKSRNSSNPTIYTQDSRYYSSGDENIIYSTYSNLIVKIDNDVTFEDNKEVSPIHYNNIDGILTLTGSGKLTVKTDSQSFIRARNLRITDANLDLFIGGYLLVYSNFNYIPNLNICNSTITSHNGNDLISTYSNGMNCRLTDCYISDPVDGEIIETTSAYVVDSNGNSVNSFTIVPGTKPDKYAGLKVAGTQVTSENKDSIGDTGASYDPDTKTLTLKKNFTATDVPAIENTGIDGLKIKTAGSYTITENGTEPAFLFTENTEFTGTSNLTVNALSYGVKFDTTDSSKALTIAAPLTINSSLYGIYGRSGPSLKLNSANIKINNCANGAVVGFNGKITLGTNIVLDKPQPNNISSTSGGIRVSASGALATEVATAASATYGITVNSTGVTRANCHDVLNNGNVSYDPSANILYVKGNLTKISSTRSGLTVSLTGDTNISGSTSTVFTLGANSKITGNGKLTCGAFKHQTGTLTIEDIEINCTSLFESTGNMQINNSRISTTGSLTASGNITVNNSEITSGGAIYTNSTSSSAGKITIDNSRVTTNGSLYTKYGNLQIANGSAVKVKGNIYSTYGTISISDTFINEPKDAAIGKSGSYNSAVVKGTNSNTLASNITIAPKSYGLRYGYKQVDSTWDLNNLDGNNKVSFDPDTNTLTIKGTPSTSNNNIYSTIPGLIIKVEADSDFHYSNFILDSDTTIIGPGKLSIGGSSCKKSITFDNVSVEIGDPEREYPEGESLHTTGDVNIINSDLDIVGTIYSSEGRIILDNSHITGPKGAKIETYGASGEYIAVDGYDGEGVQIRKGYGFKICGEDVTASSKLFKLGPDGALIYNPETNTITFTKDCVCGTSVPLIENIDNSGLNIDFNGHNVSTGTETFHASGIIQLRADTNITGKTKIYQIKGCSDAVINIKNADIECAHLYSTGRTDNVTFNIIDSHIYAYNSMYAFGQINLEGCYVSVPAPGLEYEQFEDGGCGLNYNDRAYTLKTEIVVGEYADYGFSIYNNKVNSLSDLDNLGNNGEFSYDPEKNTLTLLKDIYDNSNYVIQNVSNNGLIINGNGHTIESSKYLTFKADTVITGKLNIGKADSTITSGAAFAISVNNATLTVEDADLYINRLHIPKAAFGILASGDNSKLVIKNSNFSVESRAGISGFNGGITLDSCKIKTPKNYNLLAGATQIMEPKIAIAPIEYYPLYVAGVQVSEQNCHSVLEGYENYTDVEYVPEEKKLIFTDISAGSNWCIDNQGIDGLMIQIDNDITLNSLAGCIRIADGLETTIEACGNEILTLNAETGISCGTGSKLYIKDIELNSSTAKKGIFAEDGGAFIEMLDSNVNIRNASNGAFYGFTNGVDLRGCEVKTNGCILKDGSAVASVNETVKSTIFEIGPSSNKTDISDATMYLNTITYCYDGQNHQPMAVLTYNGKVLELGKDYIYSCRIQTAIGTYEAKAFGIGNFEGQISAEWKIAEMYSVKFTAGKVYSKKMYETKSSATVKAPNLSDKKFWRWETTDGKVLSYSQNYSFIVTKDVELVAQYVDKSVDVTPLPILNMDAIKTTYNGNKAIGFVFSHSVPKQYNVTEVGIKYGTNKLLGYTTGNNYAEVNLMNNPDYDIRSILINKATNHPADYKNNNGTYTFACGVGGKLDNYLYAIGYIKYHDEKTNKDIYVYSDTVVAATYNTAE
ncbi:hypothetical protein [Ruminococcus flavefaciens]|uniref:hypothetical protein n=1 Tax=Ruminococcus flavefaciens TaxID=1265 RepID=UPI00048D7AA3|nr:hypothetical protein [Ruminococcus flavefaciens]